MVTPHLSREFCTKRANNIELIKQKVCVDITGVELPGANTFLTTSTIVIKSKVEQVALDFLGEKILWVTVDGKETNFEYDGVHIFVPVPCQQNVTLEVKGIAKYSRSGEGIHRFEDPVDNQVYLYTQYEPADSRRVFPVFEQPDMKTCFTFTMIGPADWHILSNRTVKSEQPYVVKIEEFSQYSQAGVVPGAYKQVIFEPTLKQSSYITALAAGPYEVFEDNWCGEDSEGRKCHIPLRLFCRKSMVPRLEVDDIFLVTKQGFNFFQKEFGYPYPWGKYDQIFVPEYNLGAMENPGLVTFTENYLPPTASRHDQARGRANTILHEMSHMWFGDLVTPRWWDDLWIKESFAEFMGTDASAHATRFVEAWETSAGARAAWALEQDQLPSTHPIAADIVDLEAAKQNFDGITYAKGAAAIRSIAYWVGRDNFYQAARQYFKQYAFSNATLEDFIQIICEVSGKDIKSWAQAWLQTPCTSTIKVNKVCRQADKTIITLTQSCLDTSINAVPNTYYTRSHNLSVGLYEPVGEKYRCVQELSIDFDTEMLEAQIPMAISDRAMIVINHRNTTFARTLLDEQSCKNALHNLGRVEDSISRLQLWQSLWNAVLDQQISPSQYIEALCVNASDEHDSGTINWIISTGIVTVHKYVIPSEKDLYYEKIADICYTNWQQQNADTVKVWLSLFIKVVTHTTKYSACIAEITLAGTKENSNSIETRWLAMIALALRGIKGISDIEQILQDTLSADAKNYAITAKAVLPDADRHVLISKITEDDTLSNDELSAYLTAWNLGKNHNDAYVISYAEHIALLSKLWLERTGEMAARLFWGIAPQVEVDEKAGQVQETAVEIYKQIMQQDNIRVGYRRVLSEISFINHRTIIILQKQLKNK